MELFEDARAIFPGIAHFLHDPEIVDGATSVAKPIPMAEGKASRFDSTIIEGGANQVALTARGAITHAVQAAEDRQELIHTSIPWAQNILGAAIVNAQGRLVGFASNRDQATRSSEVPYDAVVGTMAERLTHALSEAGHDDLIPHIVAE